MTDQSDRHLESSARGEATWKQAREAVAARNARAQRAGREEREAYERGREESRRAAEARSHAQLLGGQRRAHPGADTTP
jgi:hypothetical protein